MSPSDVKQLAERIRQEMAKAVIGQAEASDLLLTALFSGGHVLLEGPPGTAKTFIAQCFARTLGLAFGRIQFTPDLLPGDITGSSLFDFRTNAFTLVKGPVFCELLLADEINRTPPKTQAALLEAMQERAVTLDGERRPLSPRFTVVATQNPIEQQGTYPLPEAQLDRFLFKHVVDYPTAEEELSIVSAHGLRGGQPAAADFGVSPCVEPAEIEAALSAVSAVRLAPEIAGYVVSLVRASRSAPDFAVGASPRAAAMLALAARARAALQGRDYAVPDDVKALALPALRHRVVLSAAAEIDGRRADEALAALLDTVEAPR